MDETQVAEQARQFLAFRLDGETFALDVRQIREILDRTDVTRIPRMPAFMRGVINLRGGVVPVVDMRVKFGMGEVVRTIDTCIIVVEVDLDGETTVIGALVDGVKEVFELEAGSIEPPPRIGAKLDTDFIEGMGRRDDEFVIVLDVDRVFSADEICAVQAAAGPSAAEADGEGEKAADGSA